MTESNKPEPDVTEQETEASGEVTPRQFGRYEVVGFLGRGGFGAVYEGFDSELQRHVAIKVPIVDRDQATDIQRYQAEAQSLAKLRHSGIVSVFDVGLEGDSFYIVTELLTGPSLHQWLSSNSPTWQESAEIVAKVADALAHAHARQVVHRDIKPGNLLMTVDRGPVLVDFGLAIADQTSGDEIGVVRGTRSYMSPEQVEGRAHRIDGRTDIYSLGIVLYKLLTGRLPFRSTSKKELRRQILSDEPQPPRQFDSRIPESLERICLRAIAKSVAKRFTTAADLADQLKRVIADAGDLPRTRTETGFSVDEDSRIEGLSSTTHHVAIAGRRHVTALHLSANVRGLGGDASQLDPEDQMEAIRLLQTECRRAVEAFGSSVLPSGGQEQLFCFGYPLSYEDAPVRAIHAGLAVQRTLRELADNVSKRLHCRFQVWISIHSGIVIAAGQADQAIVGDVLTLVTKIDRETQPSEVIVTEATQRLISKHFQCEPLDARISLPGEVPIPLFRVTSAITRTDDWSDSNTIQYTPLVGRDHEVSMLLDRWELVGEGYGQLVALIGDAGLGKSRLVHVLKEHVRKTGDSNRPPIIEWSCSPYHTNSAFYPVKESLLQLLQFTREQTDDEKHERLETHLKDLGFDLATALPIFGELLSLPRSTEFPPQTISPQRQKELMLELLYDWLGALAMQRPTLFVVEDLHWIDASTLSLLQRFADEPINEPLLCVLTFRPEFTTPWTSRAHQSQIALNRLTRAQVTQIVESQIAGASIPRGMIDRLAERTDGVPLFVEEYAKMLLDSVDAMNDTVDQIPESTVGSGNPMMAIPTTLQGLLMGRLDRIGGDPNIIRLAATLGREFSLPMLAAASELSGSRLLTELEKLVKSQLLFRRGTGANCRYQFKHALIQDAAYDSMLKRQRREMHQRIAESIEKSFPETILDRPEVLAYHRTEAGQDAEAVPLWEAAGSLATSRSAYVEAIQHLQTGMRLLGSLPASPERDELEYRINVPLGISTLSLKGYAAPELGEIYDRRMELCTQIGDSMGQLHATWAMGSWRIVRDEVETCLRIGDKIMAMALAMNDDGALMEALFIRGIAQFYHGDFQDSLRTCQQGWELFDPERCLMHASRTGQHAGVAHLSYIALCHWYLGQPASAVSRMQEALQLAESLNHPFSVSFALHHFAWLRRAMQQGDDAVVLGQRQIEYSQGQAFYFWETTGMLFRAGGLNALGQNEEARDAVQVGLARYQATGAELALPQYYSFLAESHLMLGAFDAAEASLDQAFAAIKKFAEHFQEPELWRLRGGLAQRRGDSDGARQHLLRAVEVARRYSAASWELAALLDLAALPKSSESNRQVREQIAAVLDRFEPCSEKVPIVEKAQAALAREID